MKTLNLVDLDKSDIKYKISKFPDGQQQITIIPHGYVAQELPKGHDNDVASHSVKVMSRFNNFLDLELIICAVASLRGLGVKEIHLYVPYFEGSRSDRKFEEGSNNYLKDVICPVINSLKLDSVTVLDPHSDCLEMGLNNFQKESNLNLVKFAFNNIYGLECSETAYLKNDKYFLLSPDAGASKKIYKIAEKIGYTGDVIICSKDRDDLGRLTKTSVPNFDQAKDIIIIDDICDGGNTFINIAKEIRDYRNEVIVECKSANVVFGRIYLIVTHGIFSKGFQELEKYFDGIYCTNSVGILPNNSNLLDTRTNIPVKTLDVFNKN